jgi:hypothetical protein
MTEADHPTTRAGERIAEAIADLIEAVSPPLTPKEEHLTQAVLEVATELRGIRALLVRVLNEVERANDAAGEA